MKPSRSPFEVVLFDVGGVLVQLQSVDSMQQLAGIDSREETVRRWLECRWVRAFECGRCSAADFASGMVDTWHLSISPDRFLTGFATWPRALEPGAEALVASVRAQVTVGCLSNTNVLHWRELQRRWQLHDWFDRCLLSHQLGLMKPDSALFTKVVDTVGCAPGRILLLDDSDHNVVGARSAGLSARMVRGTLEAAAALTEAGVLRAAPEGHDREQQPRAR